MSVFSYKTSERKKKENGHSDTIIKNFTTEFKESIFSILENYMKEFGLEDYGDSPFSIETLNEYDTEFAKVGQHILVMHGCAKYAGKNHEIAPEEGQYRGYGLSCPKQLVYDLWTTATWKFNFQKSVRNYWKKYADNNHKRFLHSKGLIPLFKLIFGVNHRPTDDELTKVTEAALLYISKPPFKQRTTNGTNVSCETKQDTSKQDTSKQDTSKQDKKNNYPNTVIF